MSDVRLTLKTFKRAELKKSLGNRELLPGGKTQTFIDNEVMKQMQKRMTFDTGMMSNTVPLHSDIGFGTLRVVTPYAKTQAERGREAGTIPGSPLRGRRFFERTKTQCGEDILRAAAKIAEAKPKK